MDVVIFTMVALFWMAFAGAVLFSQSSIHDVWQWFKDQNLLLQASLGFLFLPWVVGMWIWETSWPVIWRGLLAGGVAWASIYAFFPWRNR